MRIAMIGQHALPARHGGVERAVEEVAARLVERGHEVTAYCRATPAGGPPPGEHRGIRLRTVPAPGGPRIRTLGQSFAATVLALTEGYDVLHYHALGPTLAAPLARLTRRPRVVVTVQGRDDLRAKWGVVGRTGLGLAARTAAHVPHTRIFVSRALAEDFRASFGVSGVVVPNGVAAPAPSAAPGAGEVLAGLGVRPGRFLLHVGRLVPEKAADDLLRAYADVPGSMPLVLVGGSSATDRYADEVGRLAARDPRVRLAGARHGDAVDALYRSAAAFVLPSKLEGLPLVLLEAIAHGLPVLVSDLPAHLEVLGSAGPGRRVVRAGDVDDLRRGLDELVTAVGHGEDHDPVLRRDVLDRFSWDRITDRTEAVYATLLRGGSATEGDLEADLGAA